MANLQWQIPEGYKLVGYEIEETEWEGKPTLSEWDNPKQTKIIDRTTTQEAAEHIIDRYKRRLCSYFIAPIFVRCE